MDFFNAPIHKWYNINKRDLPWRSTRDPYLIWLSEVIFQQTRIDQGLKYYNRFSEEFPTVMNLANASEDQVLKLWQGLGYYSRARNLHYTAKYICEHLHGIFPNDHREILKLKGIGEYTAAAIASISFNQVFPAVDGNVYRVLSRYFGISTPIDSNSGKNEFYHLAHELIQGTDPGMHNQAIMEFGALQCTPKNPGCISCPLNEKCFAYINNKVYEFPVKRTKTSQRNRFFNYIVLSEPNHYWIRKRTAEDIWKNLYEFPIIETSEKTEIDEDLQEAVRMEIFNSKTLIQIEDVSIWQIHILSHQRINYRFIRLLQHNEKAYNSELLKVNKQDIFNFAVPRLLESYLIAHSAK